MKRLAALLLALILAAPAGAAPPLTLDGDMEQGGLVIGRAAPGAKASLDGMVLDVSEAGVFAFGFDRDHDKNANLTVLYPDGTSVERKLAVATTTASRAARITASTSPPRRARRSARRPAAR